MNQVSQCMHGSSLTIRLICLSHRLESVADRYFFAPNGLSMTTGRILMCLHHSEGKTPTELTHDMGSKKSNMTQRIASLKKLGLVELKESNQKDRRSVNVVLTEAGEKLAQKIENVFEKHIQELEDVMTGSQKEQLNALLGLLHTTLDTFERSQE